jgi:SAM-dependent methyltransferase
MKSTDGSCLVPTSFIAKHAELLAARLNGPIADVAGGSGRNLVPFLHTGWTIDSYDIQPDCIFPEITRKCRSLTQHTVDLLSSDFELPLGKYSLVILVHFYSPQLIAKLISSLKPDGLFLLETIDDRRGNYHSLPHIGEIFELISGQMHVLSYQAKLAGPQLDRQVVKLLAERI